MADGKAKFPHGVPGLGQLRPVRLLDALDRCPPIGPAFAEIGFNLMRTIPIRERELATLTVMVREDERARRAAPDVEPRCSYGWTAHVVIALTCMTEAEVARTTAGWRAPGWSDADRAVLQATDALLETGSVPPELAARLQRDVFELVVAVIFYRAICKLDLEPEPEIPVVPGLETPARARATYAASLGTRHVA